MPLNKTRLTMNVYQADGEPAFNWRYKFQLGRWGTEGNYHYTDDPVYFTVNSSGILTVDLFPSSLTAEGTVYRWWKIPPNTQEPPFISGWLDVPDSDLTLDLAPLLVGTDLPESTQADALAQVLGAVEVVSAMRDQVESDANRAEASATAAALYDGLWLDTVAALIADTSLTYAPALPGTVVAGDYVQTRKGGFAYQVAASGASDQHVTTAGGVKLYVLPLFGGDFGGVFCPEQFGAIGVDKLYLDVPNLRWCTDAGLTTPATDYTAEVQAAVNAGRVCIGGNRVYMVTEVLLKSESVFRDFRLRTKAGNATNHYWSPVTIGGNFNTLGLLKKNVLVENVHVDGGREIQTGMNITRDGGRHGFWLAGYTENVTIRKCSGVYCATEGIHIYRGLYTTPGTSDDSLMMHKNLTIEDCVFDWNRRHGGSGDSIDGMKVSSCTFRKNGRNLPGYDSADYTDAEHDIYGFLGDKVVGDQYGVGFDMEGYQSLGSRVRNIVFRDCELTDNIRDGYLMFDAVDASNPGFLIRENISLINCILNKGVANNQGGFAVTVTAPAAKRPLGPLYRNVQIVDCVIDGKVLVSNVTNYTLRGGILTTGGTLGTCTYATNVRIAPGVCDVTNIGTVDNADLDFDYDRAVQATWNPGTIVAGGKATTTIALAGVFYGDLVQVTHTSLNTADNAEVILTGYVVFPGDSIQIVAHNTAGSSRTVGSGTVKAVVRKLKRVHP